MGSGNHLFRKGLVLFYLVGLHLLAGFLIYREIKNGYYFTSSLPVVEQPALLEPLHTPIPVPSQLVDLTPEEPAQQTGDSTQEAELDLTIPVKGIRQDQLLDTFYTARGEGRNHDAIDIMAPEGTPVVAATDGVIARFFDSVPGGITVYQYTSSRRYMLYYAHLQRRADGLEPGAEVTRGQTIGYVGDTGNAGKGNFHLHFSVSVVRDPARYWEGDYLNPFPLLKKPAP